MRTLPPLVKRSLDILVSLWALTAVAPLLTVAWLAAKTVGGGWERAPRVGRGGREFGLCRLALSPRRGAWIRSLGLDHAPALWNVLRGDLSLVGPRPLEPGECYPAGQWRRHHDRPGLVCLWWIRQRANIDFDREADVDSEYVESASLRTDLGIMARAPFAWLLGRRHADAPRRLEILGIPLDNIAMDEAIELLGEQLESDGPARQACFVNADCANLAQRDADYQRCLANSHWNFADGIGLKLAARMRGLEIRQNVNGTDLFPRLLQRLEEDGGGLYLLGGRPEIAERTAEWVRREYPRVRIVGYRHGFFSADQDAAVVQEIAVSGADLLLVAFGAPRQDVWISERLEALHVRLAIGVGGLFDFYSGGQRRAPIWMRELGLEWLYRLVREPRRLARRYLIGNPLFLFRAARDARRRRVIP